jgi:crotonobetainyl-CoA:carnitine CoA-transferase CaiB-like acyl-CoA transferase
MIVNGPLSGYRIVDSTQMLSGPAATMLLGDQGADVIKVEPLGIGDATRLFGGKNRGFSPMFATTNRSKRSLAINLKAERGLEILGRLIKTADVFVQNFRPGVVERMGIGEQQLRAINPRLIYVSISGFGETGPYASKRVYDPVIQALSGLAAIQGTPERPRMFRLIVPDKVTALTASQAITAALLARERSGEGQHVRLAMLDAVISFLWPEGMARQTFIGNDIAPTRPVETRDLVFETLDGFITAGAITDREWIALARAVGHPEWGNDERFNTAARRIKNIEARLELTASALRNKTSAEWLSILEAADVPCAQIHDRESLLDDPQVRANELLVESVHPHAGRMRQTRPAARFDKTPAAIARPAPLLGEHTDELLGELAFSDAEIATLRAAGVVE